MSPTPQPDLRTLLRLLRGELTPQQGLEVREQLAADLTSARRFATLLAVTQNAATPAGVLTHVDDVACDDVAAFIEGILSASEEATFEEQCWRDESLLREVVSNWNPGSMLPDDAESVITKNRMLQIALDSVKSDDPAVGRNGVPALESLPQALPLPHAGRPRSQRRKVAGRGTAVVVSIAVLAIVAMVAVALWDRQSVPNNIVTDPPKSKTPAVTLDQEFVLKDSSPPGKIEPVPNGPNRPAPNDTVPPVDPRKSNGEMVVAPDTDPSPKSVDSPKPIVGTESERPQRVPSMLSTVVESWSDDGGIVVVRSPSREVWTGIRSSIAETIRTTSSAAMVMTLQNSRAELTLDGNGQIIVDGESSIEILATEPGTSGPDAVDAVGNSTSADIGGQVLVQYGRIALNQLPPGKKITVRIADIAYSVQAQDDNTSIGIDYVGDFPVFAVFRGEVMVDDHRLTRRSWARADSPRGLTEFSDLADDADWTKNRLTAEPALRSLVAAVNKSDSADDAVGEFLASENPPIAFQATQVLLQCAARGPASVPVDRIREAAFSPVESVRHSLVYWMLMELKHNRGRDPQLLDWLLQPIEFPDAELATLKEWFVAANAGQRPTQQQLTELQSALRSGGPIFGRQCAKFFLQKILNDPLNEYDPAAPINRPALNSITQKMRTWQQNNLPLP